MEARKETITTIGTLCETREKPCVTFSFSNQYSHLEIKIKLFNFWIESSAGDFLLTALRQQPDAFTG